MCNKVDLQCFYCTTLIDVIFIDKSFCECYVTTCALQYAVVCWVTAEELVKIIDPVELEAWVLAKSVHSECRTEKHSRVDAEFEEVMNKVCLEQGLWQDVEHTARARE